MIYLSKGVTIVVAIVVVLAICSVGFLLYRLVFLPMSIKKKINALQKRYSHFDAKLIGQDSQYFHRLEVISRTNLLYAEKYEIFSRRFKTIFENEDKYCAGNLKQLNTLLNAKQFKTLPNLLDDTKKAIDQFEKSVNSFDADLYKIIHEEEERRKATDAAKETFRRIKQIYYTESSDIEMAANSFTKTFEKIEATFARFDDLIEAASYQDIDDKLPELNSVLAALEKVLAELPSLCTLTKTVVAEKISDTQTKFREIEKTGIPLYHLNFKSHLDDWRRRNADLNKRLINLQIAGVRAECELIISELNDMAKQLDEEVSSKEHFNKSYKEIYDSVNDVEKVFVKLCASLPQVEEVYKINKESTKLSDLSSAVSDLTNSKRFLEGFVYSGIRQPYSLLNKQLDELKSKYEIVASGVGEFKTFVESLKSTSEEAYKMIFVYFKRIKQIEKTLKDIGNKDIEANYVEKIDAVYDIINDIYDNLQSRPIDVTAVASKNEQLKNLANAMFDEIDEMMRESALAESYLVKLNKNRDENDVNQNALMLESGFFKGDFKNVYYQAKRALDSANN